MTFHFGPFTLDAAAYRLVREGAEIELSPKLIDLLLHLVRRPSTLVTKEELFEAIWPDVTVTENALTRAVSEVRQALGDDASAPAYIQTVARRGYRFIAAVRTEEVVAAAAGRPLGMPAAQSPRRETASLDAFRQFSEGRLHLESLRAPSVPEAIVHFERAIALDPRYALAHVGLAGARFWAYELSRERNVPDGALLATAISDARRAIELDPHLAEAHATLSFILVSAGRFPEAQRDAARAIELEPGYWGHYFRLGHASWGEARLKALHTALELYPDFAFAHFEIAMVAVARGRLDHAEGVLREGIVVLERQVGRRERFPASGLHWMLGLVRLARGDAGEAQREFETEIQTAGDRLYAREFTIASLNALGAAAIRGGAFDQAIEHFSAALGFDGEHARTCLGRSLALSGAGRTTEAAAADSRARSAIEALARGPRTQEAALLQAVRLAAAGHPDDALQLLVQLVTTASPGFTGWTIPIEPLLEPVRQLPGYVALAATLAARTA